jgi:hypothetical protein
MDGSAMTATTLIPELLRAANGVENLSPGYVTRLIDHGVAAIRQGRESVGIIPIKGKDALIYPLTVAAAADRVPREEWKHALLHVAEMLRDLNVVAASGTLIRVIQE